MDVEILVLSWTVSFMTILFVFNCCQRDDFIRSFDREISKYNMKLDKKQKHILLLRGAMKQYAPSLYREVDESIRATVEKDVDIQLDETADKEEGEEKKNGHDRCMSCGAGKSIHSKEDYRSCWWCGALFGKKKKIKIILDKENGV